MSREAHTWQMVGGSWILRKVQCHLGTSDCGSHMCTAAELWDCCIVTIQVQHHINLILSGERCSDFVFKNIHLFFSPKAGTHNLVVYLRFPDIFSHQFAPVEDWQGARAWQGGHAWNANWTEWPRGGASSAKAGLSLLLLECVCVCVGCCVCPCA